MNAITVSETIEVLKDMFSRLGNPVNITADNGATFTSTEFKTFCSEFEIYLYNTTPHWPQQNGEVERQNRDILKCLSQKTDWKEDLLMYLSMYNSTPHSTTGRSPSGLFFN